jgi:hypothetical protein
MADQPSSRRFQFSLWTLLTVVTLAAVVCGIVALLIDNRRLTHERDEAMERAAVAKETLNKLEQENRVLINQLHQLYREQPGGPLPH